MTSGPIGFPSVVLRDGEAEEKRREGCILLERPEHGARACSGRGKTGAKRVPYSSSSTAGATTSGTDAVGSNRRTTLPSRSTRNFVKFHLTDGLEA